MKNHLVTLLLLVALLPMFGGVANAQVQFQIPVTFTAASGTPHTTILSYGVSGDGPGGIITDNTYGVDLGSGFGAYEEFPLPPPPPTPIWDLRWVDSRVPPPPFPQGLDTGLEGDYHGFFSSAQVDSHKVQLLGTDVQLTNVVISWPANLSDFATSCILKSPLGLFPQVNMLTQTSVSVTGALAAAGGIYIIQTGAFAPSPGPTFSISPPAPLNFGNVPVGGNSSLGVTVSNLGQTNALTITSAPTTPAGYTVVPVPPTAYPINIPALGSYNFNVTFAPVAPGAANGNVVWTHNAPGSPTSYAVTGTGVSQGGTLQFASATRTRFDNTTGVSDSIGLAGYVGGNLKAVQFEFMTNGLLIFRSISKGRDISTPSSAWNFNYVISRGPTNADGSSNDTVKVVLYGNGTTTLAPGTYTNLIQFEYDVVNISEPDVQLTSMSFGTGTVVGSLVDGTNAGLVGGPAQAITINNRALLGDVNNDDRLDILDLLEIVDHILEIDPLTGSEFTRADIAPWTAGQPAPTPDGVVNVQDLALLQNIILTGMYPDGSPIETPLISPAPVAQASTVNPHGNLSKLEPGMDAKLTLYVTKNGIAVKLENAVPVKGIQLEFENVVVPEDLEISTILGQAFHSQNQGSFKLLMYNQSAITPVGIGDRIVSNVESPISDPPKATLKNFVIAGLDNKALDKVEVVISLSDAPELPTEFALSQNYPNPFNPSTSIKFSVPELANVKILIYNILGQEIRALVSEQVDRGTKVVEWDGKDNSGQVVPSGAYIYRMSANGFSQANKMLLLK